LAAAASVASAAAAGSAAAVPEGAFDDEYPAMTTTPSPVWRPVLETFLDRADLILTASYSAVLYGSAARGEWLPGVSDVNVIVVAEELEPPTLAALDPALEGWRKARQQPPLLVTRDEWRRASDVFPIEITDMRLAYRVERGADPLAGMAVSAADLRRALEREFRGKLLRLRQGYAAHHGDPSALGRLARESVGTLMVLFRSLLALVRPDTATPITGDAVCQAAAARVGFAAEALALPLRHRADRSWAATRERFEAYLDAVQRTVGHVDQFDSGDAA
jgi:predicted nucleotidyltransferase